MKIDCLMGTCGRYSLACEALSCFLEQTALSSATLLVYNQHEIPLQFCHPRVRVVNEVPPAGSLRHIRRRMIELADPTANLIHFWDDDDLYLPWHLRACLDGIEDAPAWKPRSSWLSVENVRYSRHENRFEGSWVFQADYLRSAPIDTDPTYTDHPVYMQTERLGQLRSTELAGRTSYIYRWSNAFEHVSAGLDEGSEEQQAQRLLGWRERSRDVRQDGKLVAVSLRRRWRQYLDGTKHLVAREDWEANRREVAM